MKRIAVYSTILLLICCSAWQQGYCVWNKVGQFPNEIAVSGFFWDEFNGFVGFGHSRGGNTKALIRRTIDGGKTWTLCTSPNVQGAVTSIFMKDKLIGYSSIFESGNRTNYSIWKTVDGGNTWVDITQGNPAHTNCIYATSKALIRTTWDNNDIGGVSTNDGGTFSAIFSTQSADRSNGIDFVDDAIGVVTMGPPSNFFGATKNSAWYTKDGGITWSEGDAIPESWGVYGVKGSNNFLTMSEDGQNNPGQRVYWSQNGGVNWSSRFTFNGSQSFTGHIAGVGNTVYAQTDLNANQGLYRSDNIGQNWKNVGGPSNNRDTRFVVTGCKGQVVYAFDNQGDIWKTVDGGDGTLNGSSNGEILSFSNDSLYEETRYCQPITWNISLLNPGCSSLTIDLITLTPNPYNEFTIGGSLNGSTVPVSNFVDVPITFRSDSNVTRHAVLHIKAHSGNVTVDTTIILVAKHSTAPEPYLVDVKATKVGDTVLMPVFLRLTKDSFAITHLAFHLSYDGDILTPAYDNYETIGTLSTKATVTIGPPEPSGILVTINLPKPITQDSDLTKPLIYLRMGVTLSRYMSCPVRLDTFAISNTAPLPLCNIPLAEFRVDPECGDSTIAAFMLDGKMPTFLSINPNPNHGNDAEAVISLPKKGMVSLDLMDANGAIMRKNFIADIYEKGTHIIKLNTSGLPSGVYILQLSVNHGSYSSQHMVIMR